MFYEWTRRVTVRVTVNNQFRLVAVQLRSSLYGIVLSAAALLITSFLSPAAAASVVILLHALGLN